LVCGCSGAFIWIFSFCSKPNQPEIIGLSYVDGPLPPPDLQLQTDLGLSPWTQGLVNHWANRANARDLALLGVSRLNTKILLYWIFKFLGCSPRVRNVERFDYCVYYRFRKLTTLAFIAFEWLKGIEPNRITFSDPRIRSKPVHPRASVDIFQGGATSKFCLSFSGCWRCSASGYSQNALPFLPISLCWLNLNSQSFVWNVFYTSAIRNAFSIFHKLSNIHFFEHFLEISHNLRITNG